jgi:hypothetical protein
MLRLEEECDLQVEQRSLLNLWTSSAQHWTLNKNKTTPIQGYPSNWQLLSTDEGCLLAEFILGKDAVAEFDLGLYDDRPSIAVVPGIDITEYGMKCCNKFLLQVYDFYYY